MKPSMTATALSCALAFTSPAKAGDPMTDCLAVTTPANCHSVPWLKSHWIVCIGIPPNQFCGNLDQFRREAEICRLKFEALRPGASLEEMNAATGGKCIAAQPLAAENYVDGEIRALQAKQQLNDLLAHPKQ
jgi:hypothetical protein